jgi:chromosome segregation ATPase
MPTKYNFLFLGLTLFALSCGASKELTAEMNAAKTELNDCRSQLAETERQLTTAQQDLNAAQARAANASNRTDDLRAENETLQSQLIAMQNQLQSVTEQMQAVSDDYGVWFRVQIGAYEDLQIDQELETTPQLALEQQNNLQKIVLGRYRDYTDAKSLQSKLQTMGVKGAWVVSYRDGVRVPISEARNR